jgi:hypothetical protein
VTIIASWRQPRADRGDEQTFGGMTDATKRHASISPQAGSAVHKGPSASATDPFSGCDVDTSGIRTFPRRRRSHITDYAKDTR